MRRKFHSKRTALLLAAAVLGAADLSGCIGTESAVAAETVAAETVAAETVAAEAAGEKTAVGETAGTTAAAAAEAVPVIDVVSETEETMGNPEELVQGKLYAISDVRVRKEASTESEKLGTLKAGDEIRYTGRRDDWVEVVYHNEPAYVASAYLTEDRDWKEHLRTKNGYKDGEKISLDPGWRYAEFSEIRSGTATMYVAAENRKNKIIGVNAGHGTKGGSGVKTWCHPDQTPKVTGGTTAAGATKAVAVSSGMTFCDGTPESSITWKEAQILKELLLQNGYDVLMIRDGDDVQLDNVARTVICNNVADCHIAIHWDGDGLEYDKGCFYMSVPDGIKYLENVASVWERSEALGDSLIAGLEAEGNKIYGGGNMDMDLTQTSYSSVPSVDIELGNQSSDHSEEKLNQLAAGLLEGINRYFGK